MMKLLTQFILIFFLLIPIILANNQTVFIPGNTGIRIRLNEPLFTEASQIFYSLFAYKVQTVQIPQQQQCFPEGCFSLYNFRITGFRQPHAISLMPLAPNLLHVGIMMFDLDIIGVISGNLQIVLSVPITGGIVINAKSLSLSATLDLQKTQYRTPYLRVSGCQLRGGFYDARVIDLGLLTESINLRYKQEMIAKARDVIQSTICSNFEAIVKTQVNLRLAEVPSSISIGRIVDFLDDESPSKIKTMPLLQDEPQLQYISVPRAHSYNQPFIRYFRQQYHPQQQPFRYYYIQRYKRQSLRKEEKENRPGKATITEITHSAKKKKTNEDDDYDLWGHVSTSEDENTSTVEETFKNEAVFPLPPPVSNSNGTVSLLSPTQVKASKKGPSETPLKPSFSKLIKLINIDDLNKLFIDLDFIDSVAGNDFFSVGISGQSFVKTSKNQKIIDTETPIKKLKFPPRVLRRNMDLILNDYTPNSILSQAHKSKLLRIYITSNTPTFGKLLRTTCSIDEVCLSDSINEAAELYPNRQFEALIETIRAPKIEIQKDLLEISLVGLSTFYLSDTRQTVGKIPFSTKVHINIQTKGTILQVHFQLKELKFLEDLDFFDLPADSLNGFKNAIKGTIENVARQLLANGIDLTLISKMLNEYGLSNFNIELLNEGMVLIQSDVDVFKLAFDGNDEQVNLFLRRIRRRL